MALGGRTGACEACRGDEEPFPPKPLRTLMGRAGARRKLCPCGFVAWAAASLRLASAARGGHGDAGIERSRGDPMINADDRGLGAALARDRCCTHGGVSWNAFVGNSPVEFGYRWEGSVGKHA